ncbi:MAG TPA: RNA polymerase sigma factor [Acidimicrobiales bacterium]|nr:RNA polymerase sigma factor [Acidimicrobiales bacterium]
MHAYPAEGSTGDDDAAFAAICEQHRARLVAYCRRRLGTPHDAEDAAHEALVRAYRAMEGFDHSTDAWPWLRTIAGRVCTDMQRRAARAPAPGFVDGYAADDVHDEVVSRLRADIVDDAIDRLSPRYRSVLLLREYGGWSYDDIARAHGKSLSSVRSILTRGRRRLGAHVESIAKARGQWPLPGVVPSLRRVRDQLRTWRHALDRSGSLSMAAYELSSTAGRILLSTPAVATVLTLSSLTAVGQRHAPGVTVAHAATTSAAAPVAAVVADVEKPAVIAAAHVRASKATATASARAETFTRLDADAVVGPAPPSGMPPAGGTASVTRDDDHLWLHSDTRVGDTTPTTSTNIPCAHRQAITVACSVVGLALRTLPKP